MSISNELYKSIYSKHEAYVGLQRSSSYNEELISQTLREIDVSLELALVYGGPAHSRRRFFRRELDQKFRRLEGLFLKGALGGSTETYLVRVAGIAKSKLWMYFLAKLGGEKFSPHCFKKPLIVDHLINMKNDGYSFFSIDQKSTDLLAGLSEERLRERREFYDGKENWRGAHALDSNDEIYKLTNDFLVKNFIREVASDYLSIELKLHYIAVDYSHNRQTWFKGSYSDLGYDYNKTAYMHHDEAHDSVKMLIYLTDVNRVENGAFQITSKKEKVTKSITLQFFYSAIELTSGLVTSPEDDFYRALYKSHRQQFHELPYSIQGATHFGDDVIPGSELEKKLLTIEKPVLGGIGTAVLFDGFNCIHRGGVNFEGERLALQVGFTNKDYFSLKTRFKRKLLKSFNNN